MMMRMKIEACVAAQLFHVFCQACHHQCFFVSAYFLLSRYINATTHIVIFSLMFCPEWFPPLRQPQNQATRVGIG